MVYTQIFKHCRGSYSYKKKNWWYANGVHLSAIWDNTALVQWIRCEPLGEHLIHWICAVFSQIARKMSNVCIFSHDEVTHDIIIPYVVLNLQLECDMGWYRYTSHSENHSKECENQQRLPPAESPLQARDSPNRHTMLAQWGVNVGQGFI